MAIKGNQHLTAAETKTLLATLKPRFEKNLQRHKDIAWEAVQQRLQLPAAKTTLRSLQLMEETGGEPDLVGLDKKTGEFLFYDCSPETPLGRRSLCYDDEALQARKENKPAGSALGMAREMGIEVLNEAEYRYLQSLGQFDCKTSSWLKTPAAVRKLGGAIFGDSRYGQVFTYHNGVQSYYAGRSFRGSVKV